MSGTPGPSLELDLISITRHERKWVLCVCVCFVFTTKRTLRLKNDFKCTSGETSSSLNAPKRPDRTVRSPRDTFPRAHFTRQESELIPEGSLEACSPARPRRRLAQSTSAAVAVVFQIPSVISRRLLQLSKHLQKKKVSKHIVETITQQFYHGR